MLHGFLRVDGAGTNPNSLISVLCLTPQPVGKGDGRQDSLRSLDSVWDRAGTWDFLCVLPKGLCSVLSPPLLSPPQTHRADGRDPPL